jgi:hypothetical protein
MKKNIIGIDFDNTIVSYDELMHKVAVEQGWIDIHLEKDKKIIRDSIRLSIDGEVKWQRLQATVYGPRIGEAKLIDGVTQFFETCKKKSIQTYIISHKTLYSNLGESQINLREAALGWMKQHHFLNENGLGLNREQIFFESHRNEKALRAAELQCTHFIDDLEETFLEPQFPEQTQKILFSPHLSETSLQETMVVSSWDEINQYFFNETK